jgi:hypothetical protein
MVSRSKAQALTSTFKERGRKKFSETAENNFMETFTGCPIHHVHQTRSSHRETSKERAAEKLRSLNYLK